MPRAAGRSRLRRLGSLGRLIGAAVVLLVALSGCGAARSMTDDAVRVAGQKMGTVDDLVDNLPQPRAGSVQAVVVNDEILRVTGPLQGLDPVAVSSVLDAACLAKDLAEVNDARSVVDWAIQEFPNAAGYRAQVEALAAELVAAKSAADLARVLASAAVCQYAAAN